MIDELAVISDIHGNLEALLAVLDRIESLGIRRVVCLGDTVGYGPNPVECLDLVLSRCQVALMGNHEYYVSKPASAFMNQTALAALKWTHRVLRESGRLRSAAELRPRWQDGDLYFVHGSVRGEIADYLTELTHEGQSTLDEIVECIRNEFKTFRVCFVGHNHKPFLATEEGFIHPHDGAMEFFTGEERLYVSVGSVGQPRDGDRRSCFATFDGESVRFHRVPYPAEVTARKIRENGLPASLAERLL